MSNKNLTRVNYESTYRASRGIAKLISGIGWVILLSGSIAVLRELFVPTFKTDPIVLMGAWLAVAVFGLLIVAAGQITRATVDNTDNTGEILAILKARESIRNDRIGASEEQLPSIGPPYGFDPTRIKVPLRD